MEEKTATATLETGTCPPGISKHMVLPQFRCHKIVRAAKITAIYNRGDWHELIFGDLTGKVRFMPLEWIRKHLPVVGGYYVEYTDGYNSFSPSNAFEDGYTEITSGG